MYPFVASLRQKLNTSALNICDTVYPLMNDRQKSWLFEKSVAFTPVNSKITVIHEDEEKAVIVKKEKNGQFSKEPFKILSTSDIHLGDDPQLRKKAMQMLENQIAESKPDLVVLTGDIVLTKFQQLDAVQFARFMEKTGVYWAIVFGNHEV
ncbi:MAG: metallophosphoesterase, partial [Clostridia bacterium]|nr:metallophosphoesterase [Clostridia bacterium]